jgi:hypothetical protein
MGFRASEWVVAEVVGDNGQVSAEHLVFIPPWVCEWVGAWEEDPSSVCSWCDCEWVGAFDCYGGGSLVWADVGGVNGRRLWFLFAGIATNQPFPVPGSVAFPQVNSHYINHSSHCHS